MFTKLELRDHQINAILDAISILETSEKFDLIKPEPETIDILKTMAGIKLSFPEYMNKAIAEGVEKEGKC